MPSKMAFVTLNGTSFILDELKRWTDYRIWVHAGTSVGDGPASSPITIRTHEDGMFYIFLPFFAIYNHAK